MVNINKINKKKYDSLEKGLQDIEKNYPIAEHYICPRCTKTLWTIDDESLEGWICVICTSCKITLMLEKEFDLGGIQVGTIDEWKTKVGRICPYCKNTFTFIQTSKKDLLLFMRNGILNGINSEDYECMICNNSWSETSIYIGT